MTSSNKMRLQKYIAQSGYTSRRKAEVLIQDGKVSVNGVVVSEQGVMVDDSDIIKINGQIISLEETKVYYIIHKPRAVLSSVSDDRGRVCVVDLVDDNNRIFPVGRLDYETTGALILTNDGEFANFLTHPRYDMPKKYRVKVQGRLKKHVIMELSDGVMIEDVSYQGVEIFALNYDNFTDTTQFNITLYEGKNRQIRRMFKHYGLPVITLHRYAIGALIIDDIKSGQYRQLSQKEVDTLLSVAKGGR